MSRSQIAAGRSTATVALVVAITRGVTVIVEACNLATWTRFKGPDAEVATTASTTPGVSNLQLLPALPRTLGVRVEVGS